MDQSVFQHQIALDFPPDFFVYPAASHHNLRDLFRLSHVDKNHLQIFGHAVFDNAVIGVKSLLILQGFADIDWVHRLRKHAPILWTNPNRHIIVGKARKPPHLQVLAETAFRPAAHPIGLNEVFVQVHIKNGFIIDAQPLDELQPLSQLVVNAFQFLIIALDPAFQQALFIHLLILLALSFFRGVCYKNIKKRACGGILNEMSKILHPANLPAFLNNSVFHII